MTTTPPLADVPIRSADELTRRWTLLLAPPVFGARSLWLSWLGSDGRMLPVVIPIDDLPELPDAGLLMGLRQVHDGVTEAHLDARVTSRWRSAGPADPRSPRRTTSGRRSSAPCSTTGRSTARGACTSPPAARSSPW